MIFFVCIVKSAVKIEWIFRVAKLRLNFFLLMGEAVGDIFQEDETEYDVFIIGGIKLLAEFISRYPKFFI